MAFIAAPRTILAAACAAYVLGVVSTVSADQIAQRGKALSSQEIQQQLQVLGFNSGPIGGTLSERAEAAVRAFQIRAGVAVTGLLDKATMAELVDSAEAKMLHSMPPALLPVTTAEESFGTKIILRPAKDRQDVMVLVIPRYGGYLHRLQYLGLTKDGHAHVESSVWTQDALHEFDEPLTLAGFAFAPDAGKTLQFRVDRAKGYVFMAGQGQVTPPDSPTLVLGPEQQGMSIGHPLLTRGPRKKK